MGHFAMNCAISGLPLEGGASVRVILLVRRPRGDDSFVYGRWSPYFPPFAAQYCGYGSFEKEESTAEGATLRDAILSVVNQRLVERGVGHNSVHDVAVRRPLDWSQLKVALLEERLLIRVEQKEKVEYPTYVPRLATVEAAIAALNKRGAYQVEEKEPGHVTIRAASFSNGQGRRALQKLIPSLHLFAVVLAARQEGRGIELVVRVSPGRANDWEGVPYFEAPAYTDPQPLAAAMVREEVWQAVLRMGAPHRPFAPPDASQLGAAYAVGVLRGDGALTDALRREPALCDGVNEILQAENALSDLRRPWQPSHTCGPQEGDWLAHLRFHQEVAAIAQSVVTARALVPGEEAAPKKRSTSKRKKAMP